MVRHHDKASDPHVPEKLSLSAKLRERFSTFLSMISDFWGNSSVFSRCTLAGYAILLFVDLVCSIVASACNPVPGFLSYQRDSYPDTLVGLSISWLSMFAVIQIILNDTARHHDMHHRSMISLSFVVVIIPLLSIVFYAKCWDTGLSGLTFAQVLTVIYLFTKFIHQKSTDISDDMALQEYKRAATSNERKKYFLKHYENRNLISSFVAADLSQAKKVDKLGQDKASLDDECFKECLPSILNPPDSKELDNNYQRYMIGLLTAIFNNSMSNSSTRHLAHLMKALESSECSEDAKELVWELICLIMLSAFKQKDYKLLRYLCGSEDENKVDGSCTKGSRIYIVRNVAKINIAASSLADHAKKILNEISDVDYQTFYDNIKKIAASYESNTPSEEREKLILDSFPEIK